MTLTTPQEHTSTVTDNELTLDQLHCWYGHVSKCHLRTVLSEQGLQIRGDHLSQCKTCIEAKQTRTAIGSGPRTRAGELMHTLHSDVCGPMPVDSLRGKHYFLSIINNHSCYTTVCLLQKKSDAYNVFKNYLAAAPSGCRCQSLRSNQGGEYMLAAFCRLLEKNGIMHDTTASHMPELNGVYSNQDSRNPSGQRLSTPRHNSTTVCQRKPTMERRHSRGGQANRPHSVTYIHSAAVSLPSISNSK